jgi:hypothetical protein
VIAIDDAGRGANCQRELPWRPGTSSPTWAALEKALISGRRRGSIPTHLNVALRAGWRFTYGFAAGLAYKMREGGVFSLQGDADDPQ